MTAAVMSQKGRVVVPLEVRQRHGWDDGTALVFTDGPDGVRVMSADEALAAFRASLPSGPSPVTDLIAERRAEAARESGP
ncbi:MAG: AbrB/MazE/SpoVT family DNA-binding domain-containing protein [Bifidobacteriaceae bacterium]|nr:AbrB/MazE/SpoVT family DNA-binding domain-containing protein [Bifidobacteriaceae bacterium]